MVRDRVVVLGRRGAGKTVYLARLYEAGWNSTDPRGLRMMAVEGRTHSRMMTVIDSLKRGEWPAATTGNDPFVIDIPMFRQLENGSAFMDNDSDIDEDEWRRTTPTARSE